MRQNRSSKKESKPQQPWKLLLWAAVASLLFGAVQFGEILEDALRVARNSLHPTAASGQIVFVGIDERSVREVGSWPWPRSVQGGLIERAHEAGAKEIYFDVVHVGPTKPQEDAAFATALRKAGNVVLPVRETALNSGTDTQEAKPHAPFIRDAKLGGITVAYNYQNAAWILPTRNKSSLGSLPTFATLLADYHQASPASYRADYSVDPNSIPYVSAADLFRGNINANALKGKKLLIALDSEALGDRYWIPGRGKMAGGYIQVLGAETLLRGVPADFGFIPPLLLCLGLCCLIVFRLRGPRQGLALGAVALLVLFGPAPLEAHLLFIDVTPALFLLVIVSVWLARLRWRKRGLVNNASGLANLEALRATESGPSGLVAGRVHNYAEIASTLNDGHEAELARQIAARLAAGSTTQIFQGDEGIFVWLADPKSALGNHLEALHAMFRSPLAIGSRQVDVAISFGVELGSARSLNSRLGSALVAADEAWEEGLKWKLHDPAREEEVSWRVSLLGELDSAIDNGEVWLAYQPQYDIKRGIVVGAEALARWTHPQKGPISPSEFVAAAEAQGRIAKLTDFVLDRAIATAAAINRRGVPFQIAVNLSARMLSDPKLLDRIERMLRAHGLPAAKLTLELTETAALQGADSGLAVLDQICRRGIRIAIDDYGTGLSTLEYMKKVPASEIKIDQTFVKAMRANRSDLIMVQSTIALAQSLGRTVVAEGVEDRQCLEELTAMGCDIAQGFAVGRPMGVRELVQRLQVRSARKVA